MMATITVIAEITASSVSAPPPVCLVGREHVCCYSSRPPGGGPICLIHWIAGDGREVIPTVDVREQIADFGDTALASPFVSGLDGTLKAFCSYIPAGGGNDRKIAIIATGLVPEVTR
jgi:hypothetical protein